MRKPKNNKYRKREFITQSAKKRKMGAERAILYLVETRMTLQFLIFYFSNSV